MSKFKKGAEASKEASKGAQFARTNYFSLKDKEECIVRFITDAEDWVTVDQHNFVPTKPKPEDFEGDNWPNSMGAVCRKTKLEDGSTLFDDCYICDHMKQKNGKPYRATGRTWALAVMREEVTEDGEVVGYRDRTREVAITDKENKPTGETKTEKDVVVVNMGYRNFFSTLQGFAGRYGTVLDRDYYIKREGDDKDTTYHIVPMDPIDAQDPDHPDDDEATVRFDLRDERFMARYVDSMPDLDEVIENRASEEFYNRMFVPGGGSSSSDGGSDEKPSADVDEERVSALAERVKGYSSKGKGDNGKGDSEDGEESKPKGSKSKAKALD